MNPLLFTVQSDQARELCRDTAQCLVELGVSLEEAVARINHEWKGIDFEPEDGRFHETPLYWALTIFFGKESLWWRWPKGLSPRPPPPPEFWPTKSTVPLLKRIYQPIDLPSDSGESALGRVSSHPRTGQMKKWRVLTLEDGVERHIVDRGEFDELVVQDWLHVERMSEGAWWLRVGDARVWVAVDENGHATAVEVERDAYPLTVVGPNE